MNIQFDFADSFSANVRGRDVEFDLTKLHANSLSAVFAYGLQRKLNDSAGAAGKRDEYESEALYIDAAVAAVMKTWDALVSGESRVRGPRAPKQDAVTAIAMAKALAVFKSKIKQPFSKYDRKSVDDWCRSYLERNPTVVESARLEYEAALAAADSDDGDDIEALLAE